MRVMPAASSVAAHSSNSASARSPRPLIDGSPPPRTMRSPWRTPPSTAAAVSSVVLKRYSHPSVSAAAARVRSFMFDAAIISARALRAYGPRPEPSDFTATPHSPASIAGASKMRLRSAASSRSRFEGPAAAPMRRRAANTAVRGPPLFERVDRLGDRVERGGVDLRGALVALAPRERVGSLAREAHLVQPSLVELHRRSDVGRVERRRLVDEARR